LEKLRLIQTTTKQLSFSMFFLSHKYIYTYIYAGIPGEKGIPGIPAREGRKGDSGLPGLPGS
jgi:hypothetical protein